MKHLRNLLVPAAALLAMAGCEGLTVGVGLPAPDTRHPAPPAPPHESPYPHLPRRQSFTAMSSVDLKEGCYAGDFVLGRSQIRVKGAGVEKTVIHGNLVLQTQCEVADMTVMGDVIFEGHQAELKNVDFFGRVIDQGMQNRY